MNQKSNSFMTYVVASIFVFTVGIFVGSTMGNDSLKSVSNSLLNAKDDVAVTRLYDYMASDANVWATDANATSANLWATDANATDANIWATDANATSSNYRAPSSTDNVMFLRSFSLEKSNAIPGGTVYVNIDTNGATLSGATVVFKNSTLGTTFSAPVYNIGANPYIKVPETAVATNYAVTEVLLFGNNSDNSSFTKKYSKTGDNVYDFDSYLTVTFDPVSDAGIVLNDISLLQKTNKKGEKVYLDIDTSEELTSLHLQFTNSVGVSFNVYAKSISSNPYFEIPSNAIGGFYGLTTVTLVNKHGATVYTRYGDDGTEQFDFNVVLGVLDENAENVVYNNEDIDSEILTDINGLPEDINIVINADASTIINSELFNAIKGQNKTITIKNNDHELIFNGIDVKEAKTIDASMSVEVAESDSEIGKLIGKGVVVNFADNGNLPGNALVRVKITNDILNTLGDKVYVYYYNEFSEKFTEVTSDVTKTSDGYYEFAIAHHSDYVLVDHKLADSLILKSDVVSFQKGNTTLWLLIGGGVIIIAAVVTFILVLKKKKN